MNRKLNLALLLIFAFVLLPLAAVQAAPVGTITALEGRVDLTAGGQTRDVRVGDQVSVGDILRSKSKSKAEIKFLDGNILRLAENTRLRVSQYQPEEGRKSYFNLFRGKTQAVVDKLQKKGTFEIHTPTAICGVRGTMFFAYFQNGQSGFAFQRGSGYGYNVKMPTQVVTINAGQAMVVTAPDRSPTLRPATSVEIDKHAKDTTPTEKGKEEKQEKKEEAKSPEGAQKPEGDQGKQEEKKEEKKEEAKTEKPKDEKPPQQTKTEETKPQETKGSETQQPAGTTGGTGAGTSTGTATGDTTGTGTTTGTTTPQQTAGTATSTELPPPAPPASGTQFTEPVAPPVTPVVSPPVNPTQPIIVEPIIQRDTTPPQVMLTSFPPGTADTNTATFGFSANEPATYTYRINGGTWNSSSSPSISLSGLPDGINVLDYVGVDSVGNASATQSYKWSISSGTSFTNSVAIGDLNGTLSGKINESTGTGNLSLAATGPSLATTVTPLSGTMSDGAVSNADLAVIVGSWRGLYNGLANKEGKLGYLTGSLTGTFNEGVLNGDGTVTRIWTPYTASGSFQTFADISLPYFRDVDPAGGLATETVTGQVRGYRRTDGGILGMWGYHPAGGGYYSGGSPATWTAMYGAYNLTPVNGRVFVVMGDLTGTDDGQGHVTIQEAVPSGFRYLDADYLGTMTLRYAGSYPTGNQPLVAASYDSVGVGTYDLAPLTMKGIMSGSMQHFDGASFITGGTLAGLLGSASTEWNSQASLTMMGSYVQNAGNQPSLLRYGTGGGNIAGTAVDGGAFRGYLTGGWQDNTLASQALILYVTAGNKAGYLEGMTGGVISGAYYGGNANLWQDNLSLLGGREEQATTVSPANLLTSLVVNDFQAARSSGLFLGKTVKDVVVDGYAMRINDQNNWGIWNAAFGGTYDATATATADLSLGGKFHNTTDLTEEGLWKGQLAGLGQTNPGTSGIFSGSALTNLARYELSGAVANAAAGDTAWQATGIGSYTRTPMYFSSSFSGEPDQYTLMDTSGIYQSVKGRIHHGVYTRMQTVATIPGQDSFWKSQYEYDYFVRDGGSLPEGFQQERIEAYDDALGGRYRDSWIYRPDGSYLAYRAGAGKVWMLSRGGMKKLLPVPNLAGTAPYYDPVSRNLPAGSIYHPAAPLDPSPADVYVRSFAGDDQPWSNDVYSVVRAADFSGLMAGAASLKDTTMDNQADLYFLGQMGNYTGAAVFNARLLSYDAASQKRTTPDGDAYYLNLMGAVATEGGAGSVNNLNGVIYGLYVNPTGTEAGFLRGGIFAGTVSGDLGMWEATGRLYREEPFYRGAALPFTPDKLLNRLSNGNWVNLQGGYMGASVELGSREGYFLGSESTSGVLTGYDAPGWTLNIKGLPDYGIFQLNHEVMNRYRNPDQADAWAMNLSGLGSFGSYTTATEIPVTYPDSGVWFAGINNGLWQNGFISGGISGRFLTLTKAGTITGEMVGSYRPDAAGGTEGTWQAVSGGVWRKETTGSLTFASRIDGTSAVLDHEISGYRDYGNGEFYSFGYNDRDRRDGSRYGWSSYANPSLREAVSTSFNASGPNEENMTYYSQTIKTVWTDAQPSVYSFTQNDITFDNRGAYIEAMTGLAYSPKGEVVGYGMYGFNSRSNLQGIFAGQDDLWAAGRISRTEFLLVDDTSFLGGKPFLFGGILYSSNPLKTDNPFTDSEAPIGGAYVSYLGGAVNQANRVQATLFGLYMDRDRNIGILNSWDDNAQSYDLTGNYYPGAGAWEGSGAITSAFVMTPDGQKISPELTPQNFAANVFVNSRQLVKFSDPGLSPLTWGEAAPEIDLRLGAITGSAAIINPARQNDGLWGIWSAATGGEYDGDPATWAGKAVAWEYSAATEGGSDTALLSARIDNVDPPANSFSGIITGATADWINLRISVMGGEIRGLFDPANPRTWMAFQQGAFMDAATFFARINSMNAADRAAMERATRIPCSEVGRADFAGNGNNMSIQMNGVQFLRFQTEAAPRIWGTNSVTGTFTDTPVLNAAPITLRANAGGNDMTASFNMQRWTAPAGNAGNWGAAVNGGGALNRTDVPGTTLNVKFSGAAAGGYQVTSGTGGTINGVAAGIVK